PCRRSRQIGIRSTSAGSEGDGASGIRSTWFGSDGTGTIGILSNGSGSTRFSSGGLGPTGTRYSLGNWGLGGTVRLAAACNGIGDNASPTRQSHTSVEVLRR